MKIWRRTIQPRHFLILILLSFFCSFLISAQEEVFERIINRGELVVGMSGEQPPFNFVTVNHRVAGYDVELAHQLGKLMGVEVKLILMPFADLFTALQDNKIDAIISAFTYTKARKQEAIFIGPYALSGKSLLQHKKNFRRIISTTGFNHESIHLQALEGSTSLALAKTRLPKARITTVKHYEYGLLALSAGDADALLADIAICELAVLRDTADELITLKKVIAVEEVAIVVNRGETVLEAQLKAHLLTLVKYG